MKAELGCSPTDGRKWVWKKSGEGLSERLVEGTVKFGGGYIMQLWAALGGMGCSGPAKLMETWMLTSM